MQKGAVWLEGRSRGMMCLAFLVCRPLSGLWQQLLWDPTL
jgi:hypothetical protein